MAKDKLGAVKGIFAGLKDDSITEEPNKVITEPQQSIITEDHNNVKMEEPKRVMPVKKTFYIMPNVVRDLTNLQAKLYDNDCDIDMSTAKKRDYSDLITEAINDLCKKYS